MSDRAIEILENEIISLGVKKEDMMKGVKDIDNDILSLKRSVETLKSTFMSKGMATTILTMKSNAGVGAESLRAAILRVMKAANRYLHIKEIQSILTEEGIHTGVEPDSISKSLTSLRSNGNKYEIDNEIIGMRGNSFWGFKNFRGEDGQIKQDHFYDKSLLRDRRGNNEKSRTNAA